MHAFSPRDILCYRTTNIHPPSCFTHTVVVISTIPAALAPYGRMSWCTLLLSLSD